MKTRDKQNSEQKFTAVYWRFLNPNRFEDKKHSGQVALTKNMWHL